MAKFCKNCGAQLDDAAVFCPGCGSSIEQPAGQPVQPQQQYAPPPPPPQGQQQYAPPPPPQGQQQYAPPPPGQQQYAPPPPQGQGEGFDKVKGAFTNTKDETASFHPDDIAQNKTWGGLAYIIFFLPLIGAPGSRYGRFHSNQGLLLLILGIIVAVVVQILSWAFVLGGAWFLFFIPTIISVVGWIFVVILFILGLMNGFTGKAKELPFIGKFRIIKY